MIDFAQFFAKDTPAPAPVWNGFPKFNMVGGHNDPEMVPVEQLVESAQRVLRAEGPNLATYNMDHGALGHLGLRGFLAKRLKDYRGIDVGPGQVLITSGSLQGLDLVNELLLNPGDVVVMEQLTYSGAISRVKRKGAEVVGVALDDDGMRADLLDAALAKIKAQGKTAKYVYLIPTIQNPTGSVMPAARRAEIIAACAKHGVPVVEDECYADLLFEGEWPHAIRAMPGGEQVIHIGSFSKSISPALRLGYITAQPEVLQRMVALKNDGGTPSIPQMIVADFCAHHFESHVAAMKARLHTKLKVLKEVLEEEFGTDAELTVPKGGIFFWLKLPENVDTTALLAAAQKEGLSFNAGREWSTDPETAKNSLRLCFALPDEAGIRAGVQKLAEVCHRLTGIPARGGNVLRGQKAAS